MSAAVEAVSAAAASSGAFGVGVVRYMRDFQEGDPCLPPGAKLVQVGLVSYLLCSLLYSLGWRTKHACNACHGVHIPDLHCVQ